MIWSEAGMGRRGGSAPLLGASEGPRPLQGARELAAPKGELTWGEPLASIAAAWFT